MTRLACMWQLLWVIPAYYEQSRIGSFFCSIRVTFLIIRATFVPLTYNHEEISRIFSNFAFHYVGKRRTGQ